MPGAWPGRLQARGRMEETISCSGDGGWWIGWKRRGRKLGGKQAGEDFMVGKKPAAGRSTERKASGPEVPSAAGQEPSAAGQEKEKEKRKAAGGSPLSFPQSSLPSAAGWPSPDRSPAPLLRNDSAAKSRRVPISIDVHGHASRVQQRRTSWLVVASLDRRCDRQLAGVCLPTRRGRWTGLPAARPPSVGRAAAEGALPSDGGQRAATRRRCSRCGRWLGMARLSAAAGRNFQARALDQSAV